MTDLVILVINAATFSYLVVWSLSHICWVGWQLRNRNDEIRFLYDIDHIDEITLVRPDPIPSATKHIVCQLWLDDESFLEWKMTESGEILAYTEQTLKRNKRPKWYMRERMYYRQFNKKKNSVVKYSIRRIYSTRGLMGWFIRRYVGESFVIAKMTGFDRYRFQDYIRR